MVKSIEDLANVFLVDGVASGLNQASEFVDGYSAVGVEVQAVVGFIDVEQRPAEEPLPQGLARGLDVEVRSPHGSEFYLGIC